MRRGNRNVLIALALGLVPGQGMTQEKGALGQLLGAVRTTQPTTTPSTPPSPLQSQAAPTTATAPIDSLTGMALPLNSFEAVVKFPNNKNCGFIVPEQNAKYYEQDVRQYGAAGVSFSKWIGACRFGLAHGNGYVVNNLGKYYKNKFTYGFSGTFLSPRVSNRSVYFDTYKIGADLVRYVELKRGNIFSASSFNDPFQAIELRRITKDRIDKFIFGTRYFDCPFQGFKEAPDITTVNDEWKAAANYCSHGAQQEAAKNVHVSHVILDRLADGRWAERGPPSHRVVLCTLALAAGPGYYVPVFKHAYVGPGSECSAAIQTAIDPFLAEINGVIAADKDGPAQADAEFGRRFAPLEAVLSQKVAGIVARYAVKVRSAPLPTPANPAVRATPRKGVRK